MAIKRHSTRRRAHTGQIVCEWCSKVIGGSSKSGLFSNYTSHVLAKHTDRQSGMPHTRP